MSKRFRRWAQLTLTLVAVLAITVSSSAKAERLRAAGTGSAIEFLRRLSSEFAARTGTQIEVIPSMGSSGALQAAEDGVLDIAVAGKPLTEEQKAKGLHVVYTLRTPFVFATSHPAPQRMSIADIRQAYESPTKLWSDGEPIRIILRPKLDSDTFIMETLFPGLDVSMAKARLRPDVPLAATDQDNALLAEHTPGSLVGITYLQAHVEKRNLRFVTIDGVEPTPENFESGLYRYAKELTFVLAAHPKPEAERFIAFVRSSEGEAVFRQALGY
jgi:phosphate transport system substrate-binding protein